MAEHVQAGLEGMLMELQQLQRVEILSPDEVKSVIKKRKHFEYKLQKRTKEKEDILSYIQYETSLLHLIGMRREKIDYGHKKDEIDFAIARRINKLFKILEHRFSGDLKIWSSHIAFLSQMGWKEQVGKVYRRCLQVHPDKVDIRISSARYELDLAMADERSDASAAADSGLRVENARTILMEAIRFHPACADLYAEAFNLELVFVNWLVSTSDNDIRSHLVAEETAEAVKEGKIAETIFSNGVENACADNLAKADFGLSCLKAAVDLDAPLPVVNAITKTLVDLSEDNVKVCESLALLKLNESKWSSRSQMEKLAECCRTFESSLAESMTLPSTKQSLLKSYVEALKDALTRFNLAKDCKDFVSNRLWLALQFGKKNQLLSLEQEQLLEQLSNV